VHLGLVIVKGFIVAFSAVAYSSEVVLLLCTLGICWAEKM